MISWIYAHRYGELPQGESEVVEALVAIAEQLCRIADLQEAIQDWKEQHELWAVKED